MPSLIKIYNYDAWDNIRFRTGGFFRNGAITGAFSRLFNDDAHNKEGNFVSRLSSKEAVDHYQGGSGTTITVDASRLTVVQTEDYKPWGYAKGRVVGYGKDGDYWVHGNVTLVRDELGNIGILKGDYDFEMHSWLKEPLRNIETFAAGLKVGAYSQEGATFTIKYRGTPNVINGITNTGGMGIAGGYYAP